MQFLRENGLNDESPRFAKLVKLFRERGGKPRQPACAILCGPWFLRLWREWQSALPIWQRRAAQPARFSLSFLAQHALSGYFFIRQQAQ